MARVVGSPLRRLRNFATISVAGEAGLWPRLAWRRLGTLATNSVAKVAGLAWRMFGTFATMSMATWVFSIGVITVRQH